MATLLHIDASARNIKSVKESRRSLSRQLSHTFIQQWLATKPADQIIRRDVGLYPIPAINQAWIDAAFIAEENRQVQHRNALALSDELIAEIELADIIVIGTPMYNYGMPAALKAWFDQIIRANKTFTFDLSRGDFPLSPVLAGKKLVLCTSSGEFGFAPGEIRAEMNHLHSHIRTLTPFLGVNEDYLIAIEYQEFADARHQQSVANAHAQIPQIIDKIQQNMLCNSNYYYV